MAEGADVLFKTGSVEGAGVAEGSVVETGAAGGGLMAGVGACVGTPTGTGREAAGSSDST
jgi:hypothetical protein